jgi:indole-3-glycerol phosphate synthase
MGTIQSVADDFLTRILRDKCAEIAERRAQEPEARLAARAAAALPPRHAALRAARLCVLAEVKRGSPSAGTFDAQLDAPAQARRYAQGGAAAISVLTDGPYFQGSLADLAAVRAAVQTPLLRKDFILDEYQLLEARAAGADLVLLIVAALAPARVRALLRETHRLGMEALVEVNTPEEARLAAEIGAALVGINNRNLHTFVVDMATTERLRPLLPATTVVAALSGIRSVEDARRMREAGADAVLVGEALVRAPDPKAFLASLQEVR